LTDLRNLTPERIIRLCLDHGGTVHQGRRLSRAVLHDGRTSLSQVEIARALKDRISNDVTISSAQIQDFRVSRDGVSKFLFLFDDGEAVEGVLIPERSRRTLCISTQSGCASGCLFCLTGASGFRRNLTPSEMIGQVLAVQKKTGEKITNLVLMGTGEPLANFDNVAGFVESVTDRRGLDIPPRKITLSTSGILSGIRRMPAEMDVSLAVSLNAAEDETRSRIMPINRKYPLRELMEALQEYTGKGQGRRVLIEYVLIRELNDSQREAGMLAALLADLPCMINLLPFNPWPGAPFERPDEESVRAFQKVLLDAGCVSVVRDSLGMDIMAACGQLRAGMSSP